MLKDTRGHALKLPSKRVTTISLIVCIYAYLIIVR